MASPGGLRLGKRSIWFYSRGTLYSPRSPAQQIDKDDDVNDQHGRDVEHGQIVRDAELGRVHIVLERRDIRVDEVEKPDDVEEPDRRRSKNAPGAQTRERQERQHSRSNIAVGGWYRESAGQVGRNKAGH